MRLLDESPQALQARAAESYTHEGRTLAALPVTLHGLQLYGIYWVEEIDGKAAIQPLCSLNSAGLLQARMRKELHRKPKELVPEPPPRPVKKRKNLYAPYKEF